MVRNVISVSGEHLYQESGAIVGISGQTIQVASGAYVIADVAVDVSSGLWIDGVSGVHIYQESGAVVGISGQTIQVASGAYVVVSSGQAITMSGERALQTIQDKELQELIWLELRKINMQLSLITDNIVKEKDLNSDI